MKKTYIQPNTLTVVLQHTSHVMIVSNVENNVDFSQIPLPGDGTGGSIGRVKESNIWDEEW